MDSIKRKAAKAAFPYTIPIMAGFIFLGIAFGIYMNSLGFPVLYPVLMGLTVFAGSMEFVAGAMLLSAFDPLYAFAMTIMVNARHLFYGISMLEKYNNTGKKKFYLIFGMCDETFAINCSAEPPEDVDKGWFMFFVTLFNQIYWMIGSTVGGLLGDLIPFDTKGLDFVMTALFLVIFTDRQMSRRVHFPAAAGVIITALCLLIFGSDGFIIPSMLLILLVLTLGRKKLDLPEEQLLKGGEGE